MDKDNFNDTINSTNKDTTNIEYEDFTFETVQFKMNKSSQVKVVVKQTEAKQSAVSNAKIVLGEPILINPNSFYTVAQVFRSIGKEAGIKKYRGNKRDLLMIVCDGLPAVLGWHTIFNTFFCNTCQLSFSELDDLKLRSSNNHQLTVSAVDIFEFDWVIFFKI